jgi:hypothetical protein
MSNQVEMVSLLDRRVTSLKGHIVLFKAKVPRLVPQEIVEECMAAGCAPTDLAEVKPQDDVSRARVEFTGDIRRSMLYLTVKMIAEENNVKNFDAGGYPKSAVVSNLLGFEINRDELVKVYQIYQNAKNTGEPVTLHASAADILRVLEADSKEELQAIAADIAPDMLARIEGKQVRDMRKILLLKFNGQSLG